MYLCKRYKSNMEKESRNNERKNHVVSISSEGVGNIVLQGERSHEENVIISSFSNNELLIFFRTDANRSGNVPFAGISKSIEPVVDIFTPKKDEAIRLLLKAVNNRTIQRNYFRLYSELMDNTISEEEFDKELEENESNYVVEGNEDPSEETLSMALSLSRQIMDINNIDDLSSLFSFNSDCVNKFIETKKVYANISKRE